MTLALALLVAVSAASEPVAVVELFTSEGCSSCPPAEAVLADLPEQPGLIPLAFHVDYWDRLGWPDAYASPAHTQRQRDYTDALRLPSMFTPQVIVNGAASVVGSRGEQVRAAISAALAEPAPVSLSITGAALEGRVLRGTVEVTGEAAAPLQLTVALTHDEVVRDIGAGENHGRRLRHVHVVRAAEVVRVRDGAASFSLRLPEDADGGAASHLVVLAQRRADLRVVGAARVAAPGGA